MNLRRALRLMTFACLIAPATPAPAGPATRTAIGLDPAKLDAFVGQYQLASDQLLCISRFRNTLYAQTTGHRPLPILPESETTFFYKDTDGQITFEKDAQGKVTAACYNRDKTHQSARKISDNPYDTIDTPETFDSPRLTTLAKQLDAGEPKALDQFWKDVQDHAPLVEPFPGDSSSSWVTFLFRGDATTRSVQILGGPPAASWDGRAMNLARLRQTDLWYRTIRIPNDSRVIYVYAVNLPLRLPDDMVAAQKVHDSCARPDSLNANFADAAGFMQVALSVLELPDAPPQPYIKPVAGTPRGTVTDHKIKSDVLKQERRYAIYTPPGYDPAGQPCPLVVMFDGGMYRSDSYIPGPTILDNLIAAKKIPATVVAFVNQVDRQKELNCSSDFATFVAKELVPRVRADRHVLADAQHTTIGGLSIGGLMASYCALTHPDVFGNVISQSGAYWIYPGCFDNPAPLGRHGGTLTDRFVQSPKLPLRFYLEAGRFENGTPVDLLAENRRLRDVLRAKGYDLTYKEFTGGHHSINWRGTFSDALIAVTAENR